MEKTQVTPDAPEEINDYKLLSVNAVCKKLGVGYNTAKQWIQRGSIESVNIAGKLRVPECKLKKFIYQKNSNVNVDLINKKYYEEDENKISSIFNELKA